MTDLEIFYMFIQIWIAIMLTIQSFILYKVFPEIKKMSLGSTQLGKLFGIGKNKNTSNNTIK